MIADVLMLEGIGARGGGILPKYAMMDPDLSLESKTIYAYFCSMAGSGKTAFPGRDTILSQLRIGKNAYYNHFNLLKENDYIKVVQQRAINNPKFLRNVYYIVSNPPKYKLLKAELDSESRLMYTGLKSGGYGYIPYLVMTDLRLDIKAKGVYAYLCTYTGAGAAAFPKLDAMLNHLQISHDTYRKYMRQLSSLGYITVTRRRSANGKLLGNDYFINENPQPEPKNRDTVSEPEPKNRDTVLEPEPKNKDTVSEPEPKNGDTVSEPEPKNGDTVLEPEPKNRDTVSEPEPKNRDTVSEPEPKKRDTENRDINMTNIYTSSISSSSSVKEIEEYIRGVVSIQKITNRDEEDAAQIVYNLFITELAEIWYNGLHTGVGQEHIKGLERLLADGLLTDFANTTIQQYCAVLRSRQIIHPKKYMRSCAENAIVSVQLEKHMGNQSESRICVNRPPNTFHNFQQRTVDYDKIVLERMQERIRNDSPGVS